MPLKQRKKERKTNDDEICAYFIKENGGEASWLCFMAYQPLSAI